MTFNFNPTAKTPAAPNPASNAPTNSNSNPPQQATTTGLTGLNAGSSNIAPRIAQPLQAPPVLQPPWTPVSPAQLTQLTSGLDTAQQALVVDALSQP